MRVVARSDAAGRADERDVVILREALFDLRLRIVDINAALLDGGDDDERQERDRITRELKQRIVYQRARLAAQERGEGTPSA